MLKAIFFDCDGVLTTDFNATGTVCENLCKAIPELSIDRVIQCYRQHFGHLQTTEGKYSDHLDAFGKSIGTKISPDLFYEALQTTERNEPMFALVRAVRKRYRLGIITDNAGERMNLLNEKMGLSELFDPIIVSASVHALKHDGTTTIFDVALEAAQCEPMKSAFIDNQERNLVTPARMGMKTYWHDDAKNNIASLKSALREWKVTFDDA